MPSTHIITSIHAPLTYSHTLMLAHTLQEEARSNGISPVPRTPPLPGPIWLVEVIFRTDTFLSQKRGPRHVTDHVLSSWAGGRERWVCPSVPLLGQREPGLHGGPQARASLESTCEATAVYLGAVGRSTTEISTWVPQRAIYPQRDLGPHVAFREAGTQFSAIPIAYPGTPHIAILPGDFGFKGPRRMGPWSDQVS